MKVLCVNILPFTVGIEVGVEYELMREFYSGDNLMYIIKISEVSSGTYTASQFKGIDEIRQEKLESMGI